MRRFSLILIAIGLTAGPLQAQFREQAPEATGLGFTADLTFEQMGGGMLGDSIGAGFGGALFGFYQIPDVPIRAGVGGSYTRFSTEGDGDALTKLSFYLASSVLIADPFSSVVPYIQGKVGFSSLDDDELYCTDRDALTCDPADLVRGRERSGLELGAAVGVDIPVSDKLKIDVSGTFTWLDLGDVTAGGVSRSGTSTNVSTFGLRGGVTLLIQ